MVAQMPLYPKHFGQLMHSNKFFSPSLTNSDRDTSFISANRFHTGAFGKIYNFYLLANLNLSHNDTALFVNSVGVKFLNERDGEYVERPKYYLNYTIQRLIYKNYWLGLGVDIGRAGYIFKGTDVSTFGSDSNWDGNLGLSVVQPTLIVAFSVNQFLNSKVIPKNFYFKWQRYKILFLEKKFNFSRSVLSTYLQSKFYTNLKNEYDAGINFYILNVYCVGTNLWVGRSLSFTTGFKNLSINNHQFSTFFSYNIPTSNQNSLKINSFELSLKYQFKKEHADKSE